MSHDLTVAGAVASASLFAGVNEEARAAIRRAGRIGTWKAGSCLWREGASPRGLFVVLSGRVRILRTRNGRQFVVHHEEPGGTLGEVPLFDGGAYPATAVAASECACLIVSHDGLLQAMAVDAILADRLLAGLARRIRNLVARLDAATVDTVRSRLAAHLLARATTSRTPTFTLAGTHAQVAEELGTVREVLTRELTTLRSEGIIEAVGRGRFRLLDEAALERTAS